MATHSIEEELLEKFKQMMADGVVPVGTWRRTIIRADGSTEEEVLLNVVTAAGMNALASRGISDTTSPFGFLAVGTVTAQASLGSTVTQFGEVSRKAGATIASSNETLILVATWAGNTDGLTGVALGTGAIVNHSDSGQGTALSLVNSVDATLQASDFLKLQAEVQVGSHNI